MNATLLSFYFSFRTNIRNILVPNFRMFRVEKLAGPVMWGNLEAGDILRCPYSDGTLIFGPCATFDTVALLQPEFVDSVTVGEVS